MTARKSRSVTGGGVYCILCVPVDGWTYVKVGVSELIIQRLIHLMTGCPFDFDTVLYKSVQSKTRAYKIEAEIHRNFAPFHTTREWFRFQIDDPEHKRAFHSGTRAAFSQVMRTAPEAPINWHNVDLALIRRERKMLDRIRNAKDPEIFAKHKASVEVRDANIKAVIGLAAQRMKGDGSR